MLNIFAFIALVVDVVLSLAFMVYIIPSSCLILVLAWLNSILTVVQNVCNNQIKCTLPVFNLYIGTLKK